jgi:hypothetical protein
MSKLLSLSSRYFLLLTVISLASRLSFATGTPGSDPGAPKTIIEISPMSITVDAGKDVQESYDITGATTATLSGTPVRPEDLRAGMVASIVLSNDGKTAMAIHAMPAPRTTKKPAPGAPTNVWINLK